MAVADRGHRTLVTGAASSGKSCWAEILAVRSGLPVTYLATGPLLNDDPDWQDRLQRHRERRPGSWRVCEVSLELPAEIGRCPAGELALVDSLGTWVAASLALAPLPWAEQVECLMQAVQQTPAALILVGEEAGWGVSPATAIGGLFRQRLGELQRQLAPLCDSSWLAVHGRAIEISKLGEAIPQEDR